MPENKRHMGDGTVSMKDILDSMSAEERQTFQKLQMLSNLMNGTSSTNTDEKIVDDKQSARRSKAKKRLQRLKKEHKALGDHNEELASALGACWNCWGENKRCKLCEGKGKPGGLPPDQEAFEYYVLPVLESLGLIQDNSLSQPIDKKSKGD